MERPVSLLWKHINSEGDEVGRTSSETNVDTDIYSDPEAVVSFLRKEVSEYYNIPDEEVSIVEWSYSDTNESEAINDQDKSTSPSEVVEQVTEEVKSTSEEEKEYSYVRIKLPDNYKYIRQGMEGMKFERQIDAYHVGNILNALYNWNNKDRKAIASEIIRQACELLR